MLPLKSLFLLFSYLLLDSKLFISFYTHSYSWVFSPWLSQFQCIWFSARRYSLRKVTSDIIPKDLPDWYNNKKSERLMFSLSLSQQGKKNLRNIVSTSWQIKIPLSCILHGPCLWISNKMFISKSACVP